MMKFNYVLMGVISLVCMASVVHSREEVKVNYIKQVSDKSCEVSIQDIKDETQVFTTLCRLVR